jgi:hypothetical protein
MDVVLLELLTDGLGDVSRAAAADEDDDAADAVAIALAAASGNY